MKRLFFLNTVVFVMFAMFFFSCKKEDQPGNVSFTSKYDFTVALPQQASLPVADTTIEASADITINDVRIEKCKAASLKSFYIEIKNPSTQTFEFCKEVHLWLSAPGVAETDVISAVNISPSAKRIDFTVSSIDLAQFLRKNVTTVKVKVVLSKGFIQPITLYGNMMFNVQGNID